MWTEISPCAWQWPTEAGVIINHILQTRKETKLACPRHLASRSQSWDADSDDLITEPKLLYP